MFFSNHDRGGLTRTLEPIKIHRRALNVPPWRTGKKNWVAVTAYWVHRRAYMCPKKGARVGYVGVRVWVHDKILYTSIKSSLRLAGATS